MERVGLELMLFLCALLIGAESSDVGSPVLDAPTSFQSHSFQEGGSPSERLNRAAGSFSSRSGSRGKLQNLSIRGSGSRDVGVFLEGIRLNSAADGTFNFGDLDSQYLEDAVLIRGPYSPFGNQRNGHLLLSLPKEPTMKSSLRYGSYGHYGFSQMSPVGSFSFDRADNDFLYDTGNGYARRENNESININFRTWKRWSKSQAWAQVLFSDQNLPGSTSFPTPQASSQTINPTLALQSQWKKWNFDVWGSYSDIAHHSGGKSVTRSFYTGARARRRYSLGDHLALEHQLQTQLDRQLSTSYETEYRSTTAYNLSGLISLSEGQILHPRLRLEVISDLDRVYSAQPGLGGKHDLNRYIILLWNSSYVSIAPTFGQMYFDSPPTQSFGGFSRNPELKREKAWHSDIGFEVQVADLKWSQAFFYIRSWDVVQNVTIDPSNGRLQAQNQGNGKTFGIENEWSYRAHQSFYLTGQYSYLNAQVEGARKQRAPEHQLNIEPHVLPSETTEISLPLYFRSSMKDFGGTRSPRQLDLSLRSKIYIENYELSSSVNNLLGWRREGSASYPLPQETWFELQVSARL